MTKNLAIVRVHISSEQIISIYFASFVNKADIHLAQSAWAF